MIEWCYQWDDPEFVEKYYQQLAKEAKEKAEKQLWETLLTMPEKSKSNDEKEYQKKSDASDALYFINL